MRHFVTGHTSEVCSLWTCVCTACAAVAHVPASQDPERVHAWTLAPTPAQPQAAPLLLSVASPLPCDPMRCTHVGPDHAWTSVPGFLPSGLLAVSMLQQDSLPLKIEGLPCVHAVVLVRSSGGRGWFPRVALGTLPWALGQFRVGVVMVPLGARLGLEVRVRCDSGELLAAPRQRHSSRRRCPFLHVPARPAVRLPPFSLGREHPQGSAIGRAACHTATSTGTSSWASRGLPHAAQTSLFLPGLVHPWVLPSPFPQPLRGLFPSQLGRGSRLSPGAHSWSAGDLGTGPVYLSAPQLGSLVRPFLPSHGARSFLLLRKRIFLCSTSSA